MAKIIDLIIENKNKEISEKILRLKSRNFKRNILSNKKGISVIGEIKLKSPSSGLLGTEKDIISKVKEYEKEGCSAISIVTDKKYFGGDLKCITDIKNNSSLPVLCKDFILNPYQICEIKLVGADAILLIAKILPREKLNKLVNLCFDLDIEPVVEVGNKEELESALNSNAEIIGVNARDLSDFSVDIKRACKLISLVPKDKIAVGFSGVKSKADILKFKKAGAKAVLIGTSLMKNKNITKYLMSLRH